MKMKRQLKNSNNINILRDKLKYVKWEYKKLIYREEHIVRVEDVFFLYQGLNPGPSAC
jgi:hypothetical protein